MNGIINIYKEKGFTSHDVVAKLRGIFKQKKIGHTGTLDPDAVGVLPVCLGNGTKLCDLLTDKNKKYEAVLKLGINTDTQDMSGTIISQKVVTSSIEEIQEAVYSFLGEYQQIPPMYSALKVNGQKLYELARKGIEVERKSRKVIIHEIDILDINEANAEVRMEVSCSKGTYIRTLCYDIGLKLGCGGSMKELIRTEVSQFSIEDSLSLSQVEGLVRENKIEPFIMKVEDMFPKMLKVTVKEEDSKFIYNGNKFSSLNTYEGAIHEDNQSVKVFDYQKNFIAIYEYSKEEQLYKPVKMFL
jgi:tRNA pseudouridine55 synthase